MFYYKISSITRFVSLICVLLIVFGIYEIRFIDNNQRLLFSRRQCIQNVIKNEVDHNNRFYAVYGHDVESGYLKHVFETFDSFGFDRVSIDSMKWNVLWAHDYPFNNLSSVLKSLKTQKKVNHFPGTGYISSKVDLATTDIKYVPKAFKIPHDRNALLNYIKKYPDKLFVQKSNRHRGIEIKDSNKLSLEDDNTFVQEYIQNPLLVDNHKFDIGVYTIITSVDPLRVYIYGGDFIFRFCLEEYYPFDKNDKNKYVIGDDYLPLWKVPSLSKYFTNFGYSMKESFNQYLKNIGKDSKIVWKRIEEAIREVCLNKESFIIKLTKKYGGRNNFFEMLRFDFTIDDELNVFIMEANMSPNLSSSHYPPNRIIYMHVLYNLFSLTGLSQFVRKDVMDLNSSLKNLMVYPELCSSDKCESCFSPQCQLCRKCLSQRSLDYIKDSYFEYNRRHECKRVFPPTFTQEEALNLSIDTSGYSPDNFLLYRWFVGNC